MNDETTNSRRPKRKGRMSTSPINPKRAKVERLETLRQNFEAEKKAVLARVPMKHKNLFNQVGFGKWFKLLSPAMIVNPYEVPPGDVRNCWLRMYEKACQKDRLESMGHLVYWIRADKVGYSCIPKGDFISYEEGSKKGMHVFTEHTKRLLEKGKRLNRRQQEMVDSLVILNELALKLPEERSHPWAGFKEEDYWVLDEDTEKSDTQQSRLKDAPATSNGTAVASGTENRAIANDQASPNTDIGDRMCSMVGEMTVALRSHPAAMAALFAYISTMHEDILSCTAANLSLDN